MKNRFIVKRARNGYMVFARCGVKCEYYVCTCDTEGNAKLIASLLDERYEKIEDSKIDAARSEEE